MLKLSEIRKELSRPEYNISGVASVIGVDYQRVRNALKGSKPNYEVIEKLSDYLEHNGLFAQRRIAESRLNDPKYADAAAEVIGAIDERLKS